MEMLVECRKETTHSTSAVRPPEQSPEAKESSRRALLAHKGSKFAALFGHRSQFREELSSCVRSNMHFPFQCVSHLTKRLASCSTQWTRREHKRAALFNALNEKRADDDDWYKPSLLINTSEYQ